MTCDEAKACFADDWCGMLRTPERDELKRHLNDCAACRQEAEGLESLWTKLDSLPAEEPSPQRRDTFYAALGAYGEGFSAASSRGPRKAGFAWLPVSIAAALLIGLGLGYAVSSRMAARTGNRAASREGQRHARAGRTHCWPAIGERASPRRQLGESSGILGRPGSCRPARFGES